MSFATDSLEDKDVRYSVHHFTNLNQHLASGPFVIAKGDGIYVWDTAGARYIDSLAGAWCTSLGFSESRLAEAASRQMREMPYSHTFASRTSVPTIELAEKLIGIAPAPLSKVFFTCSGSEAVDSVVKFVWYYNNALGRPRKKKLIARKRAYHGITVAAGSLTSVPVFHKGFDLPINDRFLHTETPCHYRGAAPGESEEAFASRLAETLDRLIQAEGPDTVAAFIAEPVMAAGGLMTPPATYFEKIQAVLKQHDVLMIADEVVCGFGRTGNMWGSQTYAIEPDLMTCAKQLSSAYLPIAGVLMAEHVFEGVLEGGKELGVFGLGYTYGGHPVPAAVALETLKIYEERDILGHIRALSPHFLERLFAFDRHPLVGQARGVGLLGGLEIVADKATKQSFPPERQVAFAIAAEGLKHGLIVRPLPGDVLGVCPPLIITESQLDEMFDSFERTLDSALGVLKAA